MSLTATDRVRALLRTVEEARVAWDTRSSGGGALLMPTMWSEGSYAELERCLILMRDGGEDTLLDPVTGRESFGPNGFPVTILRPAQRRLWWHVVMRYRYGTVRTMTVAVRRTRFGADIVLPPRCELMSGGGVVIGSKNAVARVYTWSEQVSQSTAAEGLCTLTSLMYGGRDKLIQLPVSVLHRELGLPIEMPNEEAEVAAA